APAGRRRMDRMGDVASVKPPPSDKDWIEMKGVPKQAKHRPWPPTLAASLVAFGMSIGGYANQAREGWDLGYWFACLALALSASGIAMYVHRAVTWLER